MCRMGECDAGWACVHSMFGETRRDLGICLNKYVHISYLYYVDVDTPTLRTYDHVCIHWQHK